MEGYLAMRINDRALPYWKVIDRFPTHKDEIDKCLREEFYCEPPKDRDEDIKDIIPTA